MYALLTILSFCNVAGRQVSKKVLKLKTEMFGAARMRLKFFFASLIYILHAYSIYKAIKL